MASMQDMVTQLMQRVATCEAQLTAADAEVRALKAANTDLELRVYTAEQARAGGSGDPNKGGLFDKKMFENQRCLPPHELPC